MPWKWNITGIEALHYTDNVIDLMSKKLAGYPLQTREMLGIAACIGNIFEMETLEAASGKSIGELLPLLDRPIADNVIILKDSAAFSHDRLQEAAYRLLDENRINEIHYSIGDYLYRIFYNEDANDKYLFRIADHLNAAISLIIEESEKKNLIEINLKAGKKALNSAAYKSALHYLTTGINLLSDDCFEKMYDVAFTLHLEFAEATHLNGETEEAISMLDNLFSYITKRNDITRIYIKKINYLTFFGKYSEGVKNGQTCLRLYKINLRKSYFQFAYLYLRTKWFIRNHSEEDILNMPMESNPDQLLLNELIFNMGLPLYGHSKLIFANGVMLQILNKQINIYSPAVYCGYSVLSNAIGKYSYAEKVGNISVSLNKKMNSLVTIGNVFVGLFVIVFPWKIHLKNSIPYFEKAYISYFDTGDILWTPWAAFELVFFKFLTSTPIQELNSEVNKYYDFIGQKPDLKFCINMLFQSIKNLEGLTSSYLNWNDTNFTEEIAIEDIKTIYAVKTVKYMYYTLKEFTSIVFCQYKETSRLCETVDGYFRKKVSNLILFPLHIFMYTISITKQYPNNSKKIDRSHLRLCRRHIKQMKLWAKNCPDNFLQFYLLMQAELSRITGKMCKDETGKKLSAELLYSRAIEISRKYEYINFEAIANELAGDYYLEKQLPRSANAYLIESYRLFEKWGAAAKCRQLAEKYPQLFTGSANAGNGIHDIDLMSILKVSQSISGDIELNSLLKKITHLVIENAGADKGALMLVEHGRLSIKALMKAGQEADVFTGVFIDNRADLPESLIHYVERTRETYISGSTTAPEFTDDRYLASKKPQSVLCTPIVNQGKLIGILYLENSLARDAFTKDRVEILNLLVSQAAISLENAALYDERSKSEISIRESEKKYRDLVENANDFIFTVDMDEKITSVNSSVILTLGYSEDELLTKSVLDFMGKTDSKYIAGRIQARNRGAAQREIFELTIFTRAGVPVFLEINAAMIFDERGIITGSQYIARNLTVLNRNKVIENELEIANLIQTKLLPQTLPQIPGYKSHAVYIPMDKVAGDFYDFKERDNLLQLFLADVSGHGLSSSYLALISKITLDTLRLKLSPVEILRELNTVVHKSSVNYYFLAFFAAEIDRSTRIMKYSNAGHIPPYIFRKRTGEFIELKTRGMPLGWFDSIVLEEKEIALEPGDRIILYTDGITESMNSDNEMFDEERFMEFIRTHTNETPREFLEQLIAQVQTFTGSLSFDDDVTALVLDVI